MDSEKLVITCKACRRLEDAVKYLLDYGAFAPADRDQNWADRVEWATENLAKHREICSIYKGENK